jgi:NADH:ubiquinone oxidoreductase subunit K
MNSTWLLYLAFAACLVFIGIYCLLTMRNLIKLFIGVEIISKGVSLALVATGFVKQNLLTAQAITVTFIVIEVSVVATALAIIINVYRHTGSLDIRKLTKLKR